MFKKTVRKLVVCDVICDYKKEDLMTSGNISERSDSYICIYMQREAFH